MTGVQTCALPILEENAQKKGTSLEKEEVEKTVPIVGLSALKYGDLSNQASKDYIFDVDKFSSFEGNTGPYILYTIVRIKSILNKYTERGKMLEEADHLCCPTSGSEKGLMLTVSRFSDAIETAYSELAPYKICQYIYDLSNDLNHFYHETRIIDEENEEQQKSWIALLKLVKQILECGIDLLGFSAPDKM